MLSRIAYLLCEEGAVSNTVTVKVSSRYQISLPSIARQRLSIKKGDRLLVDIQDGLLILLPEPRDYVARLEGLHPEVWHDLDTDAYLQEERESWDTSTSD